MTQQARYSQGNWKWEARGLSLLKISENIPEKDSKNEGMYSKLDQVYASSFRGEFEHFWLGKLHG